MSVTQGDLTQQLQQAAAQVIGSHENIPRVDQKNDGKKYPFVSISCI